MACIRILKAEKDKDAQRQTAGIPRQVCHYAVAKFFSADAFTAEAQQCPDKVDRQTSGELKGIEAYPGPAGGGD